MSTDALDYAESAAFARQSQESALANIRRTATSESITEAARDLDLRFWAEGLWFWCQSEKNWNERLKALGEQS